ncbi:MAG: hypothetical protein LBT29_08085 [Flavobacteriaceae bacterium]|jgi:hypothetical protein|nr:hypothetical protein [Flavobacteriaceae bacterium]
MKKLSSLFAICLLAVAVFSFNSCKEDPPPPPLLDEELLYGEWNCITSTTYNVENGFKGGDIVRHNNSLVFTFDANKAFKAIYENDLTKDYAGTWKIKSSTEKVIVFTFTSGAEAESSAEMTANTLTATQLALERVVEIGNNIQEHTILDFEKKQQ